MIFSLPFSSRLCRTIGISEWRPSDTLTSEEAIGAAERFCLSSVWKTWDRKPGAPILRLERTFRRTTERFTVMAVGRLGTFAIVRSARDFPRLSVKLGFLDTFVSFEDAIIVPWPAGFMTLRTRMGISARTTCCMATELITSEP